MNFSNCFHPDFPITTCIEKHQSETIGNKDQDAMLTLIRTFILGVYKKPLEGLLL